MKISIFSIVLSFVWLIPNKIYSQADEKIDTLSVKIQNLQQKIDSLNEQLKVKESPFKISIGASFDFLSGRSKTDLYYDVNFFVPEIWNGDKSRFWKKIGLDFSFYQTRLFGDSVHLSLKQDPKAFGMLNPDTLLAEKYTLSRDRKTTLENKGIFLSPTYVLRQNLYALIHFEGILQDETIYYEDKYTDVDSTLKIAKLEYTEPTSALRNIQPGEKKSSRMNDVRGFIGLGFMLDFTISDVTFRLKPVAGYMKNKIFTKNPNANDIKGFFYDLSIQIVEKNTGIKLGAEVRDLIKNKNYPNYTIFLSKQFSLSKLGEFITSK